MSSFRAVILDLDGVLTRTARLHARAWKTVFDDFLATRQPEQGEDLTPFDIATDYLQHVDGKPRLDGIRDFLASRSIQLPEGDPDDAADAATIRGIGARKNDLFLELLGEEPIEVFDDTLEQLRRWRTAGLGTALITSSRNGRSILEAIGLTSEFDVVIDGNDAADMGLTGKPHPDIFLSAADRLGVDPAAAVVVEDAISGVQAGKAGGFGLVVGVARAGDEDGLAVAGADVTVTDVRELMDPRLPAYPEASPATRLLDALDGRRLALFLDYDGTLTPIVPRPEDATISDDTRTLLRDLSARVPLAIVSGRDLADVRSMVGVEELIYAGSHGFDVHGPGGLMMQQEDAVARLPDLDAAERELRNALAGRKGVEGVQVERKRFAIAIHYRHVAEQDIPAVEASVDAAVAAHPALRRKGGKKIFELQPDVPWDKGRAVLWLLERMGLTGADVHPVYIGDDVTDEDAFEALRERGIGIGVRVGEPEEKSAAEIILPDTGAAIAFLRTLRGRIPAAEDAG